MPSSNFAFGSHLERSDNMPVVASRWGFKEEIIDGTAYLVPMTQEEYVEAISNDPEIDQDNLSYVLDKVNSGTASCFMYTTMACATPDNCQWCHLGNVGNSYYCYCKNVPV